MKSIFEFKFKLNRSFKKFVHVAKKNEIQYMVNETKLEILTESLDLIQKSKEFLFLSDKDKEELIPRIQKPKSLNHLHC